MIFASDLDRTLIYSKKLIDNMEKDIVLVETYLGKPLSFMKKQVIEDIKHIQEKSLFIPVTTRTIEQYNRVFVFRDYIKPKYAVTSNGGNIFVNGKIDEEWASIIRNKLKDSISYESIKGMFLESFKDISWIKKMVLRDNLFYSVHFIDRNLINIKELDAFKECADKNGWNVSVQNRKIYIVPKCVNKWDAISHIKKLENVKHVVTSGDSDLDYCMLIKSNYAICVDHGDLKDIIQDKISQKHNITITNNSGIKASKDIITIVKKLLSNNI
ncbi:conserved hypothetical protein [Clostridium botulinum C str. Eklund]|nr:conserved hypothetical protein [Clostridium botulinum C str. Eklund]NEZ49071.1 hypothetical protein [Clostridium botulinum]